MILKGRLGDKFGFALVADKHPWLSKLHVHGGVWGRLKYRALLVLIAACAYVMRRLGRLHAWLQAVDDRTAFRGAHFIALLVSFPCFKASHFFFKAAYLLQQRRLRGLCSEDFFLKFYNGCVPDVGVVHVLEGLRRIEKGLKDAVPGCNS